MKKVLITMTIAAAVLAMSCTAFANSDEMRKHHRRHRVHTVHTRVTHTTTYEAPKDACPEEVARMMPMDREVVVRHTSRPMRRHRMTRHHHSTRHHHMSKMSKKTMTDSTSTTTTTTTPPAGK